MDVNMRRVIASIDGYEQKLDKIQKDMKSFGEALNDVRNMIINLTEESAGGSDEMCHHSHEECPHMSRMLSGVHRDHHVCDARAKPTARCKKPITSSYSTQKLNIDRKRCLRLRKRNSSPHETEHKSMYRTNRTETIRRTNNGLLRQKAQSPDKLIADY